MLWQHHGSLPLTFLSCACWPAETAGPRPHLEGIALFRSHLAASEGCFRVVHWLIEQGADVNVIDRFKHTPLEVPPPPSRVSGFAALFTTSSFPYTQSLSLSCLQDAITGDHGEVAKLLMQAGGMVMHNGRVRQLLNQSGVLRAGLGKVIRIRVWPCQ